MGSTGAIATNAKRTKSQAIKPATMAHAYAMTMRPAHAMFYGDVIFTLATGHVDADLSAPGLLPANVMERTVISAIEKTRSPFGRKCLADLEGMRAE